MVHFVSDSNSSFHSGHDNKISSVNGYSGIIGTMLMQDVSHDHLSTNHSIQQVKLGSDVTKVLDDAK